ncbi:hypothetical protein GALMADRAFT_242184 [Galerina marginata CBS 339.88]|uniref:Secreted protein n=1 Tax=Galerina marginata (strain CBS 339.88) TaxID=685588 RepID=A0A067TM29_GALM3|nr:hypothetical protein GALMADRAFT_242184 [Galerina marginata CBS 339.88]
MDFFVLWSALVARGFLFASPLFPPRIPRLSPLLLRDRRVQHNISISPRSFSHNKQSERISRFLCAFESLFWASHPQWLSFSAEFLLVSSRLYSHQTEPADSPNAVRGTSVFGAFLFWDLTGTEP